MPTGHYIRKIKASVTTIKCVVCGRERTMPTVEAKQRTGLYCSKLCWGIGQRKPSTWSTTSCTQCGATFTKRSDHLRQRNFCSQDCAWQARKLPNAKWRNPEYIRAYMKSYLAAHSSQKRIYQRRTRERAKEKIRARTRLARKTLRIPREKIAALFEFARGHCVYCGQSAKLEMDHFEPILRGGKGTAKNLIPCCRACNASKGAREPADWVAEKHGVHGLARTLAFLNRNAKLLLALNPTMDHREV